SAWHPRQSLLALEILRQIHREQLLPAFWKALPASLRNFPEGPMGELQHAPLLLRHKLKTNVTLHATTQAVIALNLQLFVVLDIGDDAKKRPFAIAEIFPHSFAHFWFQH